MSGHRTQVMYVRASDRADRFASYETSFKQWAADADSIYRASALETGGARRIRFVHGSDCSPRVLNVTVSSTADDNWDNLISEVQRLGYTATTRIYMMFVDTNVYCGLGSLWHDDRASMGNLHNSGPAYSRIDAGCWSGEVAAHEHMHNIGGVQMSAPHSSGGFHCTDEYDVMCYSDPPNYPKTQIMCPDVERNWTKFDCNHDDYFNTHPTAGSYLATHWNPANSYFLVGGASPPNRLMNSGFEVDANADGRADGWSVATGFTRSNRAAYAGSFSGRHSSTKNSSYTVAQSVAGLRPGRPYDVLGRVYIPATSDKFSFSLVLRWLDASSAVLRTDTLKRYTAGTGGWVLATGSALAPAGASRVSLRMSVRSLAATVYVDQVVFRERTP